MLVAWGLELVSKEDFLWVIKACVLEQITCGLTSILARMEADKGLHHRFGERILPKGVDTEFFPFILWNNGSNKEACREEA
ncbi:hypothetical protein SUGI_0820060 [Cryptomeria japonica]|nr:hypothetical protein SUGI_0820060 [Cryptomeria japonica]